MILHGNQRGGAKDLAQHLLKTENEHVKVHDLRGFVSENLVSALNEIHAVSRGTKARQFLFSLSLNPPPSENVPTAAIEDAIDRVENKLVSERKPAISDLLWARESESGNFAMDFCRQAALSKSRQEPFLFLTNFGRTGATGRLGRAWKRQKSQAAFLYGPRFCFSRSFSWLRGKAPRW